MKKRIMDENAIDQRIGDVWFTNGYGDRFPARDSHVMLAIEGGVIISRYNHDGQKVEHSSERLCIRLQQRDRNDTRYGYWLSFYEYGDGQYRKIFDTVLNYRDLHFYWEHKDVMKIMKFVVNGKQIASISFSRNATVYEDDWRKCKKCGMEKRVFTDPKDFMLQYKCVFFGIPVCGCGHPMEYVPKKRY